MKIILNKILNYLRNLRQKHIDFLQLSRIMNILFKDDIFDYITNFLPNMTSITYKSDTIIKDINTISNICLVSKTFYNLCYQDFDKKEKNYKEFLINSYHLRKVCEKFRMDKKKK